MCSGEAIGRIEPATEWTEELLEWRTKTDLTRPRRMSDSPGWIAGLLVGRPMYYSASEKTELREIVRSRTADYSFPIVTDMDFSHTAPQFTLPLGCAARIDSESRVFEVVEHAVL